MALTKISFPYSTDVVSERQYMQHMKLYEGYVKGFNKITEELIENGDRKDSNAVYSKYRGLKCGETFSLDGVILHELYFQNLGSRKSMPLKKIEDIMNSQFGGYENFVKDLTACATSARGWVIFAYDQRSSSFRNFMLDTHNTGLVCLAFPLLVLDMYEHACATCSAIEKIAA